MRAHSIRWRLTLSYAAIACLAALALGAVLLGILRRHYAIKEREYLASNGQSIGALVSSAFAEDVPIGILQSQLENLAFISKVRIRVLDIQGQELIDTGIPTDPYVMSFLHTTSDQSPDDVESGSILLNPPGEPAAMSGSVHVMGAEGSEWQAANPAGPTTATSGPSLADPFVPQASVSSIITGNTANGEPEAVFSGAAPPDSQIIMDAVSAFPLSSVLFGFAVGSGNASAAVGVEPPNRSDQQITSVLTDGDHNQLGGIILSDSPAYGSEIVASVAQGWLLAGGIAVLLAAAAGWFVSRQISKPLLALTEVTAHMTAGDLSRRAAIARQDELGTLARSFNVMADRIQEIVITLQRFVADAAHELHTPLTALHTNLELAQNEVPSAAIRRAHEQVIRLEKLTDSLLTLSRVEAQANPSPTELVDLGGLIRSASEL
jgi:HAMP domain-containing protein